MKKELLIGAGCFWGVQKYYEQIKGIISTEVGYANGNSSKATYEEVCNNSGHVEVVKIFFDDEKITTKELFGSYIRIVEPFSLNKQRNDVGIQYRIGLYSNDEKLLKDLSKILSEWESKNGKSTIEIKKVANYSQAENYHQDYLTKNPGGYCHINTSSFPKEYRK